MTQTITQRDRDALDVLSVLHVGGCLMFPADIAAALADEDGKPRSLARVAKAIDDLMARRWLLSILHHGKPREKGTREYCVLTCRWPAVSKFYTQAVERGYRTDGEGAEA